MKYLAIFFFILPLTLVSQSDQYYLMDVVEFDTTYHTDTIGCEWVILADRKTGVLSRKKGYKLVHSYRKISHVGYIRPVDGPHIDSARFFHENKQVDVAAYKDQKTQKVVTFPVFDPMM